MIAASAVHTKVVPSVVVTALIVLPSGEQPLQVRVGEATVPVFNTLLQLAIKLEINTHSFL